MNPLDVQDLNENHVYFRAIVGSQSYGLAHEGSDVDWRGWYAPPTDYFFGLYTPPEQLMNTKGADDTFWELRKFVKLLLDNNPNVLETLWSPNQIFTKHPVEVIARQLVADRKKVLSQKLMKTYGGYATSQWGRGKEYLEREDTTMHRAGWKHLMHLCRLLLSGTHALRYGDLMVDVGEWRDKLLAVRRGELSFEAVCEWRDELEADYAAAKEKCVLPETVDVEYFNKLLIDARYLLLNDYDINHWDKV